MTDLIDDLRKAHEAATPGKWEACSARDGRCLCGLVWSKEADVGIMKINTFDSSDMPGVSENQHYRNREFLLLVQNAMPQVLAVLEAAQVLTEMGKPIEIVKNLGLLAIAVRALKADTP